MDVRDRIPVAILTGFLGSGKTTVLQHLANEGELSRTLVLVNEFGEIGLDHHLLTSIEDDSLVAVASGCICCTIRADLVQTLKDAPWRYSRDGKRWFDRVIIETTGIADPAPILQTILGDPYVAEHYVLTGVVTAVDAVNGRTTLKRHAEAVKQVAVADRLLLTKSDLLQSNVTPLLKTLSELSPHAQLDTIVAGAAEVDWLFGEAPYVPDEKNSEVAAWLGHEANVQGGNTHGHDDHHQDRNRHGLIKANCLTFSTPVDAALFDSCLQMLLQFRGPDLLRVKGIINIAGMDSPMVIHGVQHVFHPPEVLDAWPSDDRRTRIVVIAQNLNHEELQDCFAGFGLKADIG